jgi:hypothetical protein
MRTYGAGEKLWVVLINVRKNAVELKLWSDPDSNNIRYWGWLEFPFAKNQIPSADEVMETLSEVLAVEAPAQEQPAPETNQAQGVQQAAVSGKYLLDKGGAEIDIVSDIACTILIPGSKPTMGFYQVNGGTLRLDCTASRNYVSFKIQGDQLVADNGQVWIQQGSTPVPTAHQYDELAPPPAPAPTITIGERKAQVLTDFGEPQRKAAVGLKEIYFYTDLKMKVTFINGKVSSID